MRASPRFPKPYIAFMDGIVMGGGVGLSAHGRHRVVTEKTKLAMPEVGLGFFPDVGGTWLLSRAPGDIGRYFGLTGQTMNGPTRSMPASPMPSCPRLDWRPCAKS